MPTTDPTARIMVALAALQAAYAEEDAAEHERMAILHTGQRMSAADIANRQRADAADLNLSRAGRALAAVLAEDWQAVRARLAAAEAVIMAYKIDAETNWLEDGMAARNALYAALTAYDALAGTGEGTG